MTAAAKRKMADTKPLDLKALSPDTKVLIDRLHREIIGQVDAIEELVKCFTRWKAGLAPLNRPPGIFLFVGPTGVGKAQPLDAEIQTPNGKVTMGDLQVGDELFDVEGQIQNVEAIYPQGKKDIYRITFVDGRWAECTEDHLWKVYNKYWEPKPIFKVWSLAMIKEWLEANPKRTLKIELCGSVEYPKISDLPLHPYVVGALLGNGHLGAPSIILASADEELLQRIERLIPITTYVNHVGGYDYGIRGITRKSGNIVLGALSALGLLGTKSNSKFVPDLYKQGSSLQRLELLRGLMDTDGTVGINGNLQFDSVSERLSLDVQEIVRSLGGIAKITEKHSTFTYKGEKRQGQKCYHVAIRYPNPQDLFYLSRKRSRCATYQYNQGPRALRLEIVGIEKVGNRDAQCIKVSGSSALYLTNDFVVTHNTFLAQKFSVAVGHEPNSLLRIDCAEYAAQHEVAKIIGSPPGYLGHRETTPVINQAVLTKQHTEGAEFSILLFDEMEKAHASMLDLILGILDAGRLKLGDNSNVNLTNTIIIMTANLGARDIADSLSPRFSFAGAAKIPSIEEIKTQITGIGNRAARKGFRPEFFNRIDKILTFHPLDEAELAEILKLDLIILNQKLETAGWPIGLHLEPEAFQFLLKSGYDPRYGARHLKRAVGTFLETPLSNLFLSNQIQARDHISVRLDASKQSLEFVEL